MSIVEVVRKTTTVVEVAHPGVQGQPGSGGGTVTSVSVATANGVSGSVATATTTPAITLALGDITPTSVAASGNVTGANLSGTNTGDQTSVTGNAGTATALQTARNINGVAFNGTADITINAVDSTSRVPTTRTIATTAPLTGGGDLSADRTLAISAATTLAAGSMSAADKTKLDAITGTNSGDETGARIATLLHAASAKTTLVDADEVNGTDSAASFGLMRVTWANIKATLRVYFDTLYQAAFGAGFAWDSAKKTLTFGGGTVTTSAPVIDATQTWNSAGTTFTGQRLNVTDTASAAGSLLADWQINAASVTRLTKAGQFKTRGQIGGSYEMHWGALDQYVVAKLHCPLGVGRLDLNSHGAVGWASDNVAITPIDVSIGRNGAGMIEVNNGTSGTFRDIKLRSLISTAGTITLSSYTVATLPAAASNAHAIVAVTDATAATYRGALTGGGSVKCLAYCDGSSWMAH